MDITTFIVEKALILVPALIVIGQLLKSIPSVPDWIIPISLLIPGVLGTMGIVGWTVDGAVQGVLVTGVAVYGNQVWKQIVNKSDDTEE